MMVGVPARRRGWMCQCGERLNDSGVDSCAACGARYERRGDGLAMVSGPTTEKA
jgi:UDP-2-acetamido-3-amino-2,3-dideoxy-glucuronate N-acetyltransferase